MYDCSHRHINTVNEIKSQEPFKITSWGYPFLLRVKRSIGYKMMCVLIGFGGRICQWQVFPEFGGVPGEIY